MAGVNIRIATISGEFVDVESADGECAVARLKKDWLLDAFKIPVKCQSLSRDGLELEDHMQIKQLVDENLDPESVVDLLLNVSLDKLANDLKSGNRSQKKGALKDLSVLGLRGGDAAIECAGVCLSSSHVDVATDALNVITAAAGDRNEVAVETIANAIPACGDIDLRCAMVDALLRMARRGDTVVIKALCQVASKYRDPRTSQRAILCLGKIAYKTDTDCISCLIDCLGNESQSVAKQAVSALNEIGAKITDEAALRKVASFMKKPLGMQTAGQALLQLANPGDKHAIVHVLALFTPSNRLSKDIQKNAAEVYVQLAEKGHVHLVGELVKILQATKSPLLISTLGQVLDPHANNEHIVPTLIESLQSRDQIERSAAMKVVCEIAGMTASGTNKSMVLGEVRRSFDEGNLLVKQTIIAGLPGLVERGDQTGLEMIDTALQTEKNNLIATAVKVLGNIGNKKDPDILAKVQSHLGNADPNIFAAAVSALGHVAERGDDTILGLLRANAEDPLLDVRVRCAALDALGDLACTGDEGTITFLTAYKEHDDVSLHVSACTALAKLEEK